MSSKRAIRRHSCTKKIRFSSMEKAIEFMKSRGNNKNEVAYKCEFCGGYHFGHLPGKKVKKMIERRGF